ncbi:hypothetical protein EO244_01280 [Ancylomarina salipaludis]|uniref:Tetratricopeptide repeat protein n=1 Tax=Ancylomarina salipaludis TaxID=2501299 RepID=A0A4Q1JQP9_9BACT|nr:hypothetical protein [Ancylomarina salipaludis]RXQ97548.1 hypothetical protein EO244_01280 [Ancylomarina salipaludis]
MRLNLVIVFSLLMGNLGAFSQEYKVSLSDTNKAIALTNKAIKQINIDMIDDAFHLLVEAVSVDSTYRNSYLQLYTVAMHSPHQRNQLITIANVEILGFL